MANFAETVENMANNLIEVAENRGVDLTGLTYQNFNDFLDDRFDDGGEVRCEEFCDLAWEYAGRFGELDSKAFNDAQHKCIEAAIQHINVMYLN